MALRVASPASRWDAKARSALFGAQSDLGLPLQKLGTRSTVKRAEPSRPQAQAITTSLRRGSMEIVALPRLRYSRSREFASTHVV